MEICNDISLIYIVTIYPILYRYDISLRYIVMIYIMIYGKKIYTIKYTLQKKSKYISIYEVIAERMGMSAN